MQRKSAPEKNLWMENSNNSLTMQEHKNKQRVTDRIATDPKLNNSNTQQPTTAKLTEEILSKLLLPLLLNDVEMCVRAAEIANVEALMHMKSDSGITVLMLAAQHGCNDAITTLLSSVSNPQAVAEKVDSHGYTALIVAIKNSKSISALLRGVPDAYHLIAVSNAAALSYAVLYGDILACKAMLQSVPSLSDQMCLIEKTNYCGDTLLTLAAKLGKTEMIQLIRESIGTESPWTELLLIKNHAGKTALDIALENNNLEMIKVILINITKEQECNLMPYIANCHQIKQEEQRLIEITQQNEKIKNLAQRLIKDDTQYYNQRMRIKESKIASSSTIEGKDKLQYENFLKIKRKIDDLRQNIASINSMPTGARTKTDELILAQLNKELLENEAQLSSMGQIKRNVVQEEFFIDAQKGAKTSLEFDNRITSASLKKMRDEYESANA